MKVDSDAVRAARDRAGLTQEQAADAVFVNKMTWWNWENGGHGMGKGLFEFFLLRTGQRRLSRYKPE